MLYSAAISFLVLPFNHSRMTPNQMLFGIVAGIVFRRATYIYVLRQIGQITGQIGQKNLSIYHICTRNMIWISKSYIITSCYAKMSKENIKFAFKGPQHPFLTCEFDNGTYPPLFQYLCLLNLLSHLPVYQNFSNHLMMLLSFFQQI